MVLVKHVDLFFLIEKGQLLSFLLDIVASYVVEGCVVVYNTFGVIE